MNATIWLATKPLATGMTPISSAIQDVSFFPNPAGETANIRFRLESPEHLIITICDLVGRDLKKIEDENRMAGENGFTFSTADLPPGAYFYRIAGETGTHIGKFMVSAH
jgi:hypothetical protein